MNNETESGKSTLLTLLSPNYTTGYTAEELQKAAQSTTPLVDIAVEFEQKHEPE